MKLFSFTKSFKKSSRYTELQRKYDVLVAEHHSLNIRFEDLSDLAFDLKNDLDNLADSTEDNDDPIERFHRKCECGGTIMPTWYENPSLGEFFNNKQCGYFA